MDSLIDDWGLWGLFLSAFVSSTLMPGGSEAVLSALQLYDAHPPLLLLGIATLGNTLGGMSSWLIGRLLARRWPARRLHKPAQQRAIRWLERHGSPLLLLSWLPVVGDPLCVAAGWLRIGFWPALVFIALGKAARYGAILWLLEGYP